MGVACWLVVLYSCLFGLVILLGVWFWALIWCLLVRFVWFGFVSLAVLGGWLWAVYLLVLVALFDC